MFPFLSFSGLSNAFRARPPPNKRTSCVDCVTQNCACHERVIFFLDSVMFPFVFLPFVFLSLPFFSLLIFPFNYDFFFCGVSFSGLSFPFLNILSFSLPPRCWIVWPPSWALKWSWLPFAPFMWGGVLELFGVYVGVILCFTSLYFPLLFLSFLSFTFLFLYFSALSFSFSCLLSTFSFLFRSLVYPLSSFFGGGFSKTSCTPEISRHFLFLNPNSSNWIDWKKHCNKNISTRVFFRWATNKSLLLSIIVVV